MGVSYGAGLLEFLDIPFSELHTSFWVDEVARFNYSEFGDVISFDATFRTNRHFMVFVPFTAVDNHNCNVVRNLKESTIVCSCNHISRHGYLCRNVFKVLLNTGVESILEKYILRRWRRNLMTIELQNSRQRICDIGEDQRRIINDTYDVIDDVLDILRDNKEKLESFMATLKEMRDDVAKDRTYEPLMKRKECGIEQIIGFTRPDNIEIHPATGIRNKGCGTSKRLIAVAEKATVKSSRPKRMCSGCKLMSNHDIRNCPAKRK
ncbi:uncharacterized protein LOC112510813 [Cynara cardunculus var. scolymus]|uniref:uncharacterized protein LOC112510813 n=1 Tax=Cynara cardunculus var. scolymus TaxID=59895 RepID=UPI000D623452|nr:uncharacterized protein LOC112510813 [Cynara cardunculus var. scolymus]